MASLAVNYAKAIHDQGGDSEASFQLVSGLSTVFLGKSDKFCIPKLSCNVEKKLDFF